MFARSDALAAVPATVRQGTFVHWAVAEPLAVGFTYVWRFKRLGDRSDAFIEITSDATGYALIIALSWNVGTYSWALYLRRDDGALALLRDGGRIVVTPDESTGGDHRSHAERVLEMIERVIENRASSDVQSYTIAGRQLAKMPLDELLTLRKQYREEVRIQLPKVAGSNRPLRIRFR